MKIALAQINPTVGDVSGSTEKIGRCIVQAERDGAELVVFSELALTGYPPGDLLSESDLVAASVRAVEALADKSRKTAALVGFARPAADTPGAPLENAVALLEGGKVAAVHVKTSPATYDVFDERRYFRPGPPPETMLVAGKRIGVIICEDPPDASRPVTRLRDARAEIIVNVTASPFQLGKGATREELLRRQAISAGAPVVYVNQVGGNDELVFDGASVAISADGTLLGRCKGFDEDLLVVDTDGPPGRCEPTGGELEQLYRALVLGVGDYVRKCGFCSVVLGISGGIDSAVTAALASEALGPQNVLGLVLPSRYSCEGSLTDARELAEALGIKLIEVGIEQIHRAYEDALTGHFPKDAPGVTDENIQARIRGNIIMAFSNALGHLPLATGNKSELATGYCTLYGDMCGGLGVIGDVPKTLVYKLARFINEKTPQRIPESTITKPPSAELKPDQTDQEKLPPYELLDAILTRYVDEAKDFDQIVGEGLDAEQTREVIEMIQASEYKRRQAAPVLKVTSPPFGPARRAPIASRRKAGQ